MKTRTIVGIILATAAISFVAWSHWKSEKQTVAASEGLPLAVKIHVVTPAAISQSLAVSGTLVGENEAMVISETNGKVLAVKAQIGDWLAEGQTIVQVENDLKRVALEQARAQLMMAQTNHEKAQKDLQRFEGLFKEQIATQHDIENARLAARAAEAQLKGAEAALKLAQRQYDDAAIKAPLAGRLADRYVNEAAMVMPGDKIGVVVDARRMKLRTSVAENEVALVKAGQPVEVAVDALPGVKFSGRVFSVAQKTDHERTYPVEILVQNDQTESLKSGMFGRATIQVASAAQALVVPGEAVLSDAARHNYVFVEENGLAKRVEVQIGLKQDNQVQIVSGLSAGARLVVSGQQRLTDGAKVVVQN
ncbi:MAG: efflux RND transporter periplasmic adaptor subunit [candidate division KSB1 bacterium]|nr:efflux RND transporter periplasmic adaptor subunit [candidate division KSB1 bacterium]MDZ7368707.1 efflux RND transporter periplasmic adaptor subunit [candidate division KSB1 bacterium]MDZ7406552.1 efflux RND transporter periplasmic adaptor subunit [candidate division KSB1 bacterium]